MRLRPRASSSDLDEARAIAERLDRPLTAAERPAAGASPYVRFGGGAPVPAAVRPAAAPRADVHVEPHAEPVARPSPAPPLPAAEPAVTAIPKVETEPVKAVPPTIEAVPAHGKQAGEEAPFEAEAGPAAPEPLGAEALVGGPPFDAEPGPAAEVFSPEEPPIEAEPMPAAPEPLGAEELGSIGAESLVGEPLPEAELPVGAESLVEAAPPEPLPPGDWEVAEEPTVESPLETLSEMVSSEPPPPPPPSWEDLVERARELADAQAAMLIGPDGALLAATDGWPAVGAAAIAAKLLPMVAPKLVNPGALVPVKLAGQILSVWRFEVEEQPVTAAMLAEKALPVIVRPDIDELFAQGTLRS
jgi:hypothetical protein